MPPVTPRNHLQSLMQYAKMGKMRLPMAKPSMTEKKPSERKRGGINSVPAHTSHRCRKCFYYHIITDRKNKQNKFTTESR